MIRAIAGWLKADPRHGQIATLGLLVTYGVWRLRFDLPIAQAVVTLAAVLGTIEEKTNVLLLGAQFSF